MGIVITHVVELNFEKSYITLNVEFLMRWKVTDPPCMFIVHLNFKHILKYVYKMLAENSYDLRPLDPGVDFVLRALHVV